MDDDAKEQNNDDATEQMDDDAKDEEETNLTGVDAIVDKVGRDQRESSIPKVVEAEFNHCEKRKMKEI